jgi:hypothetical protein
MIYRKEEQTKVMNKEIQKNHRAVLAFYRSTIIPMVRCILPELWSSPEAVDGRPNASLWTPGCSSVFFRRGLHLSRPTQSPAIAAMAPTSSGPPKFGTGLIAYFDARTGKCPLCDHEKDGEPSDEEEESDESKYFYLFLSTSSKYLRV